MTATTIQKSVLAVVVVLCASCSNVSGSVDGPLLVSSGGSGDVGMTAIVRGEVSLDDGCLRLGGMPVIWPEGTSWDAQDEAVRLPNQDVAPLGSRVTGGGGYLSSLDGIAERYGQEVADAAEPCLGDTGEAAVFN
nr:hypothetical protein [Nocardioidaceae bacterium]